jgi:diguanylate cyclase (GGDEF)-like protein/PAS domain S-box-containing protein
MIDDDVDNGVEGPALERGSERGRRGSRGQYATAARAELRRRDALLACVTEGITDILTAESIRAVLPRVMESIARVARIDGMHVVEESDHDFNPKPYYSWRRAGIQPRRNLYEVALDASLDEALYEWLAPMRAGKAVFISRHGSLGPLPPILASVNLTSLLLVPIMVRRRHWGSVSFDDCDSEHVWAEDEINVLHLFADLLGAAITRERYVEDLSNAKTIIQNSPTVLYRLRGEPAFPMIYVSQNIGQLGYDAAALIRSPTLYQSYLHPDDRPGVHAALAGLLPASAAATTIEHRVLTSRGGVMWVESRFTPVRDAGGRLLEVEAIMIDVTERKAAEEKIARLARTDALTGLANRGTFVDRLQQVFASTQRGGAAFALLYLDLDRFKEINDTLGHPVGDRLLREASERLRALVRRSDLAARLGGDEFAVLQADLPDPAAAGMLAEKIIESLSAPYRIEARELRVGVSVGIAVCSGETGEATAD